MEEGGQELREVTDEDIRSDLFINQDKQFLMARTFLKKADPYLRYNNPVVQMALSWSVPIFISFLWLCLPLGGDQTTKFLLFACVFQPIMVTFHCISLWYILSLYLPTPSNRSKFYSILFAFAVNMLLLLNLLWSGKTNFYMELK